ncbi:hypothetical protein [Candidatus Binatus sp.]|uniref:hypothetical protein n=1 Tax=Candidatus Binatus sp. TaxID=2811406 RepID=UPI003CC65D26
MRTRILEGGNIENSGPEMLLFSTDYPYPEGTKDPIGRFEARWVRSASKRRSDSTVATFAEMMGDAA